MDTREHAFRPTFDGTNHGRVSRSNLRDDVGMCPLRRTVAEHRYISRKGEVALRAASPCPAVHRYVGELKNCLPAIMRDIEVAMRDSE
jgi:hypothetical protein